jgi:hypothetical protein
MVERRFHHYDTWEDHKAGAYARTTSPDGQLAAAAILGDPAKCEAAMRAVVREWPTSSEQNLTDTSQNRRAWLGAACCTLAAGCTEPDVRIAWAALPQWRKDAANAAADRVIGDYERMLAGDLSLWDLLPSLHLTWGPDDA